MSILKRIANLINISTIDEAFNQLNIWKEEEHEDLINKNSFYEDISNKIIDECYNNIDEIVINNLKEKNHESLIATLHKIINQIDINQLITTVKDILIWYAPANKKKLLQDISIDLISFLNNNSIFHNILKETIISSYNFYADNPTGNFSIKIKNLDDLLKLNDKPQDIFPVEDSFYIDMKNRDLPFIFVDGELVYGRAYDGHGKMLEEYSKKQEERYDKLNNDLIYNENMKNALGFTNKHVAVIISHDNFPLMKDGNEENLDELSTQLKQKFEKIYDLPRTQKVIKRLAKKITPLI